MASTVTLKARGLNTSPNQLDLEEGSLSQASNVVIRRDGIIEQRRGFKAWGNELPDTSDRVKQLTTYRDRLLRHFDSTLQFDSNGDGLFESFIGTVDETQTGLRIKFVESNGNLYFTTAEGIKKLSAANADQLASIDPVPAGAVKALDLDAEVIYTANLQTGFLPQDSAVAYRLVWNKKDNNDNLITGTPSQRAIVYNPQNTLMLQDFARILSTLDDLVNSPASTARIADGDYVNDLILPATSSASELRTNLIALAAKIDNDILYADQVPTAPLTISSASITTGVCTVTFSAGTPTDYFSAGSKIYLSGFSPAAGTLDGAQTVTTADATTITFNTSASGVVGLSSATIVSNTYRNIAQPSAPTIPTPNEDLVEIQDYMDAIITALQDEPTTVIAAGTDQDAIAALDITTTATVSLSFTIPEEVADDSTYFYQIYRSAITQATNSTVLADLTPNDELQLVYEDYPTAAQLETLSITVVDETPEDFRGANLYTNASTGEGITQANDQPPFAKDVARYRNSVFYANTRTKQRMPLNLLGVQKMIDDYDAGDTPKVTITNGTVTNTYAFVVGQQEITDIETVADVADSLNETFFFLDAIDTQYYVWFNTGSGVDPAPAGYTGIEVMIATGASANAVAQALFEALVVHITEFDVSVVGDTVTVTNLEVGAAIDTFDFDTGFTFTTTQQGRGELIQPQITSFNVIAGNLYVTVGTADYFTINSAFNENRYLVWFNTGTVTEPSVSGRTNLEVEVTGAETAAQMCQKIADVLPTTQFTYEISSPTLTVTNVQSGDTDDATEVVSNAGFTVTTTQEGAIQVLLSPETSPAIAVDETAKSFIRVINKNLGESVYGYYLSGALDIPGKMLLEARSLEDQDPFYILANNSNTGSSFNPIISPETTITNIATGISSTIITTAAAHGMENGDQVVIAATNSQPIVDGLYTITYISSTTFSIPRFVGIAGNEGAICRAESALFSENEEKSNRIYYSKFQQPEAVPIVNYFDVGSQDKAILRIATLRDSLFVFKEDGLYRISGESAPFQLEQFDPSYILLAPDSVSVANNIIYGWTSQGIQSLTEGGSYVISRDIDNIILRTQSSNYTNFKTATWGVGYESDNSYIVFTVLDTDDEDAQIAYRYSTLTQTWTTFDKSNSCGVINNFDDKLYLGCTDIAYIEQERKSFDRTDYADREIETVINPNKVFGENVIVPTITDVEVGDVFVQDQTLTIYQFNVLLNKLDMDTGVNDADYFADLEMVQGDNPRDMILALAAKLDADLGVATTDFETDIEDKSGSITAISAANPTVITSAGHGLISGRIIRIVNSDSDPLIDDEYEVTVINANTFSIDVSVRIPGTTGTWETVGGDFQDIKACYNSIIEKLNDDTSVSFSNYDLILNNTIQEAIILDINSVTKQLTLNLDLEYIVGAATIYRAIECSFTYSPNSMGDPLMLKQVYEATMMFETRNITLATISFASDLLPELIPIEFEMDGNGIFGHSNFGTGFFGGLSNSAPFRTYIPRQCQRCRYIVVQFSHRIAREDWRCFGCSLTANVQQSTRAFR
jgi:hypothetical protein